MTEEVDAQGSMVVTGEADELSPVGGIVDWVALGIIEGRLQAGDDLNSVDLAKRFGVSRTPVREALFVLSREGLVDWSPRRRPRVSAVSLKDVRELYQLRAVLYAQGSFALVQHAANADSEALWAAHRRLADAAARHDVDGYFWGNVAFRDEELRVCGNAIF